MVKAIKTAKQEHKTGQRACAVVVLVLACLHLSGCFSSIITGATMIYERHSIYKQVSDFQLGANARRALYKDNRFKCSYCYLDVEVFNGDLLLAGHLPDKVLRKEARKRLSKLAGYRRLFIQLSIRQAPGHPAEDSWITAKIRSQILADSEINPKKFKVMTADQIVYLMGDVVPYQAEKVILIARKTTGVRRVVKMLRYYHLTDKASLRSG